MQIDHDCGAIIPRWIFGPKVLQSHKNLVKKFEMIATVLLQNLV